MCRVWRWLLAERGVRGLSQLRRVDVQAYVEARLGAGIAASTVNTELTDLWAFLRYAEAQGHAIAPAVFRVPRPKRPQHPPKSHPLSPTLTTVLEAYLAVRGPAQTDHLLIYRQRSLQPNLIRKRLNRYGQAVGVKVWPHRLRHTLATRLLNQGMRITSIQRLLGHDKLDTTMIYAHVSLSENSTLC